MDASCVITHKSAFKIHFNITFRKIRKNRFDPLFHRYAKDCSKNTEHPTSRRRKKKQQQTDCESDLDRTERERIEKRTNTTTTKKIKHSHTKYINNMTLKG